MYQVDRLLARINNPWKSKLPCFSNDLGVKRLQRGHKVRGNRVQEVIVLGIFDFKQPLDFVPCLRFCSGNDGEGMGAWTLVRTQGDELGCLVIAQHDRQLCHVGQLCPIKFPADLKSFLAGWLLLKDRRQVDCNRQVGTLERNRDQLSVNTICYGGNSTGFNHL